MGKGRRAKALLVLALFALAVRVAYTAAFMADYTPRSDADSYFAIARSLANGDGFVHPLPFDFAHATAIRPPLFPAVLSVVFRVFGDSIGAAQALNIAAGVAVVVLGALVANRISGQKAGIGAGVVLAVYPPLLANDTTVLVESFASLLMLALVLFLIDGRTVWGGVMLGLLMLDRASAQWLILPLGAWIIWQFGWRHAIRFAVVAVLVVSPWVVRNAVQVGGPVLVATNGFNINALYSDEASDDHDFVDAYFDPRFAGVRAAATDEVDLDQTLRARGIDNLRDSPTRFLPVLGRNVARWFELNPGSNEAPEKLDGRNMSARNATLPFFFLVTVSGIVGLIVSRRRAASQLLLLVAGYTTIVSLFSVAVPRLRSLFDVAAAIGCGVCIAWLVEGRPQLARDQLRRRTLAVRQSVIALATCVVVIAAGSIAWRGHAQRDARDAIESAVARNAGVFDDIPAFGDGGPNEQPPRFDAIALASLDELAGTLVSRTPSAPSDMHAPVADAATKTRLASRTVKILGLLSAGEYLGGRHTPPSLESMRRRYVDLQSRDGGLPDWESVIARTYLDDAQRAVRRIRPSSSA